MKTIKTMKTKLCLSAALLALSLTARAATPEIDAGFPGGNIIVLGIEGDTVRVKQDLRDTKGNWFYWSFRVRGAEGRALEFQFEQDVVGYRGPAISADAGKTWRWLNAEPAKTLSKTFKYSFGPDEKEVHFSWSINYTEKELKAFLEKHKGHPALKIETLCKTSKSRNAELLRIAPPNPKTASKVLFTVRHHACEMMSSYVLEGILESILADTPDGRWLREHADFFIVPFVDKDGVEDGDQGKNRKPHDHNRDYTQGIHPTVRAIKEQVPAWLEGRPLFFLDMHCPSRTGKTAYFVKKNSGDNPLLIDNLKRFSAILEAEKKGPIPYKETNNRELKDPSDPNLKKSTAWGGGLPGVIFATTLEFPYSTATGVPVTVESSRLFGKDIARSLRLFLETTP